MVLYLTIVGTAVAVAGLLLALARMIFENRGQRWAGIVAVGALLSVVGVVVMALTLSNKIDGADKASTSPTSVPSGTSSSTASRATPSSSATLRELLAKPLPTTQGSVAGQPVHGLTLQFGGPGCPTREGSLSAVLNRRFRTADFRVAMDDRVDRAASFQLSVSTDGVKREHKLLRRGSGVHVLADVAGAVALQLKVAPLTSTSGSCYPGDYKIYVLDGVLQ